MSQVPPSGVNGPSRVRPQAVAATTAGGRLENSPNMSNPIHIISLGAGVQSSCMALMAAKGEIGPMPTAAIFADVQDEPSEVYEFLDYLENLLPFPVLRVSKGKLSEAASTVRLSKKSGLNYLKPGLPMYTLGANGSKGMMHRQCTFTYKIEPLRREAKKLAGKSPITMWIGISTDEALRMKDSPDRKITHIWPLIDKGMSRKDCLGWMQSNGFRKPPRSACIYCPFHSDKEWLRIKTESPSDFAECAAFEKRIQAATAQCTRLTSVPFLHNSRIPLELVDFSKRDDGQTDMFNNECEGMCGV